MRFGIVGGMKAPPLRLFFVSFLLAVFVGGAGYAAHIDVWNRVDQRDGWLFVALGFSSALFAAGVLIARPDLRTWIASILWVPLIVVLAGLGLTVVEELQSANASRPLWHFGVGTALPVAVIVSIIVRVLRQEKRGLRMRWIGHAGLAAVGVATILFGVYVATGFSASRARNNADAAWEAIGRSMQAFKAANKAEIENGKLSELLKATEPFGVRSLYKDTSGGETVADDAGAPPWTLITLYLEERGKARNATPLPDDLRTYLSSHSRDFDRLYEVLNTGEVPRWGYDLSDGIEVRAPNYLAIRRLTQLMVCDAMHRIESGDLEAASAAHRAGERLAEGVSQHPLLVSLLIGTAVEGVISEISPYLPQDSLAAEKLEAKARRFHEGYMRALQGEACVIGNASHGVLSVANLEEWKRGPIGVACSVTNKTEHWQASFSKATARRVEIASRARERVANDLTIPEMDAMDLVDNNPFLGHLSRSLERVYLTLLRIEQADAVRAARACIDNGHDEGVYASTVVPGAKWHIHADQHANSASLTFSPVPKWLSGTELVDRDSFFVPLDGSASWNFR
jgi:hypothetical protein